MQELDERVLGSWPLIIGSGLLFSFLFAFLFGLIALIMDGIFVLSEQALMAGIAAFVGFMFVATRARKAMIRERDG